MATGAHRDAKIPALCNLHSLLDMILILSFDYGYWVSIRAAMVEDASDACTFVFFLRRIASPNDW